MSNTKKFQVMLGSNMQVHVDTKVSHDNEVIGYIKSYDNITGIATVELKDAAFVHRLGAVNMKVLNEL